MKTRLPSSGVLGAVLALEFRDDMNNCPCLAFNSSPAQSQDFFDDYFPVHAFIQNQANMRKKKKGSPRIVIGRTVISVSVYTFRNVEHHTCGASTDPHVMLTGQAQCSILTLSRQLEHGNSLFSNPVCL